MDPDNTLGRRYSFNASVSSPAAESTKLNHSNANNCSFKWGSSAISPKNRSNSSTNLINLHGVLSRDSTDSSKHISVRKIDPRIVADVQSKGLASRIVKYHENGNRLSRSMSAHNLYSKPGQFPVVTLKKTDLPYRATKQNVLMTRIAPPEKSVFYGNTLSSLLRSNSVVGIHKSDEDISRENRPILHPPPTENDMAPTRSVLDVLKEISRKRINSEDPEVTEASKKNRIGSDITDINAGIIPAQSNKRQRDLNNSYRVEVNSTSKFQETRYSPEQAKKRVCNYNNDITSSLSSSAKRNSGANKRPSYQLNQTMPSHLEFYERPRGKIPKCDVRSVFTDMRSDNLAHTVDSANAVQSHGTIPTIPDDTACGTAPSHSKSEPMPATNARGNETSTRPRLTLFNKAYDVINGDCENIKADDNVNESSEYAGIQFVKPKKLSSAGSKNPVIERAQKSKLALMLSSLRGELFQCSDNDELDSTQTATEKPTGCRTKANQVEQNRNSVGVAQSAAVAGKVEGAAISDATQCVPSSSKASFNDNILTSSISAAGKLPGKAQATNDTSQISLKNTVTNSSPLVGLKLTPPTSIENSPPKQKSETNLNRSTPILQGFPSNIAGSVSQPISSSTISINKTAPSPLSSSCGTSVSFSTASSQPSLITKAAPVTDHKLSTEINKSAANNPPISAISFGTVTKSMPVNSFSFTSSSSSKTNTTNISNSSFTLSAAATSAVQPTTITTAPSVPASSNSMISSSFSFGSKIATTPTTSTTQMFGIKPTTTTSSAIFSFGTSNNSPTVTNNSMVKSPGGFSLANGAIETKNTQFSFGSPVSASTTVPASGNAFTFGSSTKKDATSVFNATASKTIPAFAQSAETAISSPSNTTPAFGSTPSTSGQSLFGSKNGQAQSFFVPTTNSSAFGSGSSKKPSSVFGGTSASTNVLPSANFGQKHVETPSATNNAAASTGGFSFGSTAAAAPAAGAFTFGVANSSANKGASNSSAPAPTSPQSSTFTFGTEAKAPEKENATNIFGGSSTSLGNTNPSTGGFSFGSASAVAPAQTAASTFNFGAASSTINRGNSSLPSPSSSFSFGTAAQIKVSDSAASKAFNFGSSSANSPQVLSPPSNNPATPNMFVTNMMNTSATPTFNFGAAAATPTTQANVAPAAGNNLFASPANMTTVAGDRPFRRATRRLQK